MADSIVAHQNQPLTRWPIMLAIVCDGRMMSAVKNDTSGCPAGPCVVAFIPKDFLHKQVENELCPRSPVARPLGRAVFRWFEVQFEPRPG